MLGGFDKYIVVLLTGFVVTYLLTPAVRSLAVRFGVVDLPNERRPHKRPTARGGGVAVVLGIYAAVLMGLWFPGETRPGGFDLHWWLMFLPSSLILLGVGLADDIRGLGAWKKLAGQIVAALWVALSGTHFGDFLGYQLPPFLDGFLVVVWIVAVINAYNLIDGLDGLASGLAIISATGLCGILLLGKLPGVYLPLIALVGACLAFLRYNFHPATIFLGDAGSMSIGFILGVISLQTFTKNTFFLSMTIPLLILGVPIYDALLAIWRRSVRRFVLRGQPDGSRKRRRNHDGGRGAFASPAGQGGFEHAPGGDGSLHHERGAGRLRPVDNDFSIPCVRHFPAGLAGVRLCAVAAHGGDRVARNGPGPVDRLAPPDTFLAEGAGVSFLGRSLPGGRAGDCHAGVRACARADSGIPGSLIFRFGSRPTFCLLAVSRTYVTVWTRARILDVLMLLFTLQAGLLLSLGIALLIDPYNASKWYLRALVIVALGHGAMILARVFYRCVEEMVLYLRSTSDANAGLERVVLYGAGGRCQLFLKERGFHNSSSFDRRVDYRID